LHFSSFFSAAGLSFASPPSPKKNKMLGRELGLLSVLSVLLAGAMSVDITDELNNGWMLALRPRQAAQNLQTFTSALGGASAAAVRGA
jgi:hypothetical protein